MSLDRIISENINRFLTEEIYHSLSIPQRRHYQWQDLDTIEWIRIGEFKAKDWDNDLRKNIESTVYFEVNSDKTQELEELKKKSISRFLNTIRNIQQDLGRLDLDTFRIITEEGKVRGVTNSFKEIKDSVIIYDEYKNSAWADILLDYTPTKEEYHEEFLRNLNIIDNNKVLLMHSSDKRIEDGVIKNCIANSHTYTPNSDRGYTYLWGSKEKGSDQSNGGGYTYYCEVPLDSIYDFSSNLEGFKNQSEAMEHYPLIAYYWQDEDAIAIKTKGGVPISYVSYEGEYFTPQWEKIEQY